MDYLEKYYNGRNLKELSKLLGYFERRLKQLIQRYQNRIVFVVFDKYCQKVSEIVLYNYIN